MPGGSEVTVPWFAPRPVLLTLSAKRFSSNRAVTVFAASTVAVHVVPEAVSQPLQLWSVELADAVAVNLTAVPTSYNSAQSAPQSIPPGLESTVPVPPPTLASDSIARWRTVSSVLAVAPELSVAVIVVAPEAAAVATPSRPIGAIERLLLPHVTPVPFIRTDRDDPVAVPSPNCPHSLMPQHRTAPSARSAQLWCHHPAVTPIAPEMPLTAAGTGEFVVVPSPRCPYSPSPQH